MLLNPVSTGVSKSGVNEYVSAPLELSRLNAAASAPPLIDQVTSSFALNVAIVVLPSSTVKLLSLVKDGVVVSDIEKLSILVIVPDTAFVEM